MINLELKMNIFIILILTALFQSCKESFPMPEPENPMEQEPKNKPEVVWQEPIGVTDTHSYLSSGPIIIDDKVVLGPNKPGMEVLQFRDKTNGVLLFEWEDWARPSFFTFIQPKRILNNNIFASSQTQAYLIDSNNGKTIWHSIVSYGDVESNVVWDDAYHGTKEKSNLYHDYSFLTRINADSGKRDTIFTIEKVNSYETSIQPVTGWINKNQDSLLIFLVRSLDFGGTLDEQLDAYAYNMTADSIEWKLIDFDPEGSSKTGPPLIEDDLVYFAGERIFYCLNAKDGSTVWTRRFEDDTQYGTEHLFSASFIKVDDKLILSPSNRNTYCLDAFTGEQIWKKTDSASSPQNMIHHKGIVYCASRGRGKLFAIDIETGEHLWAEDSPNKKKDDRALFTTGIAIDHELEYLYTTDRFFIMCLKLIEQ